jgi:hypothetical protein
MDLLKKNLANDPTLINDSAVYLYNQLARQIAYL